MIGIILASLYGIYCVSFCCCAGHQLYTEWREERNERIEETRNIKKPRLDFGERYFFFRVSLDCLRLSTRCLSLCLLSVCPFGFSLLFFPSLCAPSVSICRRPTILPIVWSVFLSLSICLFGSLAIYT